MSALSVTERPANDAPPRELATPSPRAPRAGLVSHADLARFVRDPRAFAAEGGGSPDALVRDYLEGLERRLSAALGARPRLATLAAPTARWPRPAGLAEGDPEDEATRVEPADTAPRMAGAVVLAMAVVAVAVATAAAGAAAVLARRDAN
jgi:hypothetical protein